MKYRHDGREKLLSIGVYCGPTRLDKQGNIKPEQVQTSLAEARELTPAAKNSWCAASQCCSSATAISGSSASGEGVDAVAGHTTPVAGCAALATTGPAAHPAVDGGPGKTFSLQRGTDFQCESNQVVFEQPGRFMAGDGAIGRQNALHRYFSRTVDGSLVMRETGSAGGIVFLFIPVYLSNETWTRWAPSGK